MPDIDTVSTLGAPAALATALLAMRLLVARFGAPPLQGRYATIDGLRGYLGLFVFLHHSCVWFGYLRGGQWTAPTSRLFLHFGQSAVVLFFMITGFLFFAKLLDARTRGIDWLRLFASRVLRLAPLYLFAMLLLFALVAVLSGFELRAAPATLAKGGLKWLSFTAFGAPDLNGVDNTPLLVARVTWSLPFEWLFYLALPLLALCVGLRPSLPLLALGAAAVGLGWYRSFALMPLLSFGGGIAAALLVRYPAFCALALRRRSTLAIAAALAALLAFCPDGAYAPLPLLLLALVFALIAGGNTLYGVLAAPLSRALGELAYGLYLLHGLLLFALFRFALGFDRAGALSSAQHWLLVAGVAPLLVLLCFAAFRLIEKPAMVRSAALAAWLRRLGTLKLA